MSNRIQVKKLRWKIVTEPCDVQAETILGAYRIIGRMSRVNYCELSRPGSYDLTHFPTMALAKAAAQADFETRILSALVKRPSPKPDGDKSLVAKNREMIRRWSDIAEDGPEGNEPLGLVVRTLAKTTDALAERLKG